MKHLMMNSQCGRRGRAGIMLRAALLLLLITGSFAKHSGIISITFNVGDDIELCLNTTDTEVSNCFLVTPDEKYQLTPVDNSGTRYEVGESNSVIGCAVKILNAAENDTGRWELYTESNGVVTNNQRFDITIKRASADSEDDNEKDEDDVVWLAPINHRIKTDSYVTITLGKIDYREICTLQKPNGTVEDVVDLAIDGDHVRAYEGTMFVACRVVIGPIDNETLLGTWLLCGEYTTDEVVHKRCQPALIEYNNPSSPDLDWHIEVIPKFDHAVHFGGTLNLGVRGMGSLLNCHVVTPLGEDIVLTHDSNYPYLNWTTSNDRSTCNVVIGPIQGPMLGNWVIYAYFHSMVIGYNEVRQPLNFFLYDEDNPYNQAYNVTDLTHVNRVVNIGNTIEMEVVGSGTTNDCIIKLPNGEEFSQNDYLNPSENVRFVDTNSDAICRVSIGPVSEYMLGRYQIKGKFFNQGIFTEFRRQFDIIKEDPTNPLEEERRVTYLTPQHVKTKLGTTHTVVIRRSSAPLESCHVRTPSNLQYKIMEGFHVDNVEVLNDTSLNCGIQITVDSEEQVGIWTLISREGSTSMIERRLEFAVSVEEEVGLLPVRAFVAEGNDLYIRLEKPTDLYDTCEITGPSPMSRLVVKDENYPNECGYIVRSVTPNDGGEWKISYGHNIIYIGVSNVTVTDRSSFGEENYVWVKDRPVNQFIGPEDVIYCKIEDRNGFVLFDGFGRCIVEVGRVGAEHAGVWYMTVGRPGRVLTERLMFSVTVDEPVAKAVVETRVEKTRPALLLVCKVAIRSNVTACKFRDPSGRVLIAADGVGEDRYTFHGVGERLQSEVRSHECGLRILNPTVLDVGFWRCAVETEAETFYGFLPAFCPWVAQTENMSTDPILTSNQEKITAIEQDVVTMSCSVPSSIEYCYFRAPNGTIYSLNPCTSTPLIEYIGEGFDAGECGIRLSDARFGDSGLWSCHVGFTNTTVPEQRASVRLNVRELLKVKDEFTDNGVLTMSVQHAERRQLDYCRFVRSDGLGFTPENAPHNYFIEDYRASGLCVLRVLTPNAFDVRVWTAAVRVSGQDSEIYKTVRINLGPRPGTLLPETRVLVYAWSLTVFSVLFFFYCLITFVQCRGWAAKTANHVKASVRKRFGKDRLITLEPEVKPTNIA